MEPDVNALCNALNILVKPADKDNEVADLHDILEQNINNALKSLNISEEDTYELLQTVNCSFAPNSRIRWRFVCVSLYILLSLKKCMTTSQKSPCKGKEQAEPDLLSVSQQKTIRTCLQFIISMGVLPSLLPGVGISLAARSSTAHKLKEEELVVIEKYDRLSGVTRGLVACFEHLSLRSLILLQHLGDLVASLAQLSFAPLKKPTTSASTENTEEFVMTPELWDRMQEDRAYFKKCFLSLISTLYQPLIIRELILLHGSARSKQGLQSSPPAWLKRCCVPLLVQCLTKPGGVTALVRAICESACDIGTDWGKLDTVVKVILTAHVQQAEQYYENICSQIVQMLFLGVKTESQLYLTVSLLCIKALWADKPLMFERYILDVLMSPLLLCCDIRGHGPTFYTQIPLLSETQEEGIIVTEDELSACIDILQRCFVNDLAALPPDQLHCVVGLLFRLHIKIRTTACHLRGKVEDLLLKYLSACNQKELNAVFNTLLFGDCCDGMWQVCKQVRFEFGPSGSVEIAVRKDKSADDVVSKDVGHCLVDLLQKGDKKGDIVNHLFIFIFRLMSDVMRIRLLQDGVMKQSDRYLMAGDIMLVLIENPCVQKKLTEDPTHVITFVQHLLERDINILTKKTCEHDADTLLVVLMILNVVVNNGTTKRCEAFKRLVKPLRLIRDHVTSEDLKVLCEEISNKILSHGTTQVKVRMKNMKTKSTAKPEVRKEGRCQQALFDVCDPLLPVRGHALVELTNLIAMNDKEAQRHRNRILRIFQENLKHEDSYIYLLSIYGLAVMATVYPNSVIKTLVEEYTTNKCSAELKMKVGEVLVRVTRGLGDLVPPYKAMLLNAFLVGTKDCDHLVRASSLSNLGEVCKALGFRIDPIVSEILICVQSIMQSDPAVEVRRAAVMVVTLLLQGLGRDTLKVLEDVLLDLYRTLKTLSQCETDDVVKVHVQLSLEELNKSVLEYCFPQRKLEKRLYVIDPPET